MKIIAILIYIALVSCKDKKDIPRIISGRDTVTITVYGKSNCLIGLYPGTACIGHQDTVTGIFTIRLKDRNH
ncbi:MAG: hypothetical protein JWQ09_938 [Segetibacter sp.]|nr:hypothetical protein [Segetibacter sp.]